MTNPINAAILDYAARICEPGRVELVRYPGGGEVKDLSLALLAAVEKIGECKRALAESERRFSETIQVCEWTPVYEDDRPEEAQYMNSGCGQEWMGDSESGDPPGRWMKFCPFCGGKAAFVPAKEGA